MDEILKDKIIDEYCNCTSAIEIAELYAAIYALNKHEMENAMKSFIDSEDN